MTKLEARAAIELRKRDGAFFTRFRDGDPATLAEWRSLNQIAASGPAAPPAAGSTPESARANLDRLREDGRFAGRLLAGDPEALQQWRAAVAATVDRRDPAGADG